MLLVKSEMLPTTLLEKLCTPVTIEPANADPGKVGIDGPGRPAEGADGRAAVDGAPPKPGEYLGHHIGTNTGPVRKTSLVRSS